MNTVSVAINLPVHSTDPQAYIIALAQAQSDRMLAGDILGSHAIANLIAIVGRADARDEGWYNRPW